MRIKSRLKKLESRGPVACPECGQGGPIDENTEVHFYGLPPKPGDDPSRYHPIEELDETPCKRCGSRPLVIEVKGLTDKPRNTAYLPEHSP